jgi:DNA-binding CsgD family transcriptional regulator
MTTPIALSDAGALLKLVLQAVGPVVQSDSASRQRTAIGQFATLVQADVWVCVRGRLNLNKRRGTVRVLDGGWQSRAQRDSALQRMGKLEDSFPSLEAALAQRRFVVLPHDDLLDAAAWKESTVGRGWRSAGFEYPLIAAQLNGASEYSALGLYRRRGRHAFSQREQVLAELFWQHFPWPERETGKRQLVDHSVPLTPREREVVSLLVKGDSRKQVALKLKLSEHTIADYLKEIYRKFQVRSRAELLAQFITTGRTPRAYGS